MAGTPHPTPKFRRRITSRPLVTSYKVSQCPFWKLRPVIGLLEVDWALKLVPPTQLVARYPPEFLTYFLPKSSAKASKGAVFTLKKTFH